MVSSLSQQNVDGHFPSPFPDAQTTENGNLHKSHCQRRTKTQRCCVETFDRPAVGSSFANKHLLGQHDSGAGHSKCGHREMSISGTGGGRSQTSHTGRLFTIYTESLESWRIFMGTRMLTRLRRHQGQCPFLLKEHASHCYSVFLRKRI